LGVIPKTSVLVHCPSCRTISPTLIEIEGGIDKLNVKIETCLICRYSIKSTMSKITKYYNIE